MVLICLLGSGNQIELLSDHLVITIYGGALRGYRHKKIFFSDIKRIDYKPFKMTFQAHLRIITSENELMPDKAYISLNKVMKSNLFVVAKEQEKEALAFKGQIENAIAEFKKPSQNSLNSIVYKTDELKECVNVDTIVKSKNLLFSILLLATVSIVVFFAYTSIKNDESIKKINSNTISVTDYSYMILPDSNGENWINYTIIISNNSNWNKQPFSSQGEFAQIKSQQCFDHAKKLGYESNIIILGETEDGTLAFGCENPPSKINLFINNEWGGQWSWENDVSANVQSISPRIVSE